VQTIASLEQKATGIDADGDGKVRAFFAIFAWSLPLIASFVQVDMNELRDFLSEAGALDIFGANSVQEVMSIFDSDGNGTLDMDELASLMEFIEEEKARMLAIDQNKSSIASNDSAASQGKQATSDPVDNDSATLQGKQTTSGPVHVSAKFVGGADADGDGRVDLEEVSDSRSCIFGWTIFALFSFFVGVVGWLA
jgi:hypothetical protein